MQKLLKDEKERDPADQRIPKQQILPHRNRNMSDGNLAFGNHGEPKSRIILLEERAF